MGNQNSILSEFQSGFRKGYSTADNAFSLMNAVNRKKNEVSKKIYSFFVDFQAAFDRVNRNALFYKLTPEYQQHL